MGDATVPFRVFTLGELLDGWSEEARLRFEGRRQVPEGSRPTWEELVAAEPRLGALLAEARGHRPAEGFCANAVWYGRRERSGIRERVVALVGWYAESDDPLLWTAAAYDVAYNRLYAALPDCDHGERLGCW